MRRDIDVERELARELIRAILKIVRIDELAIAHDRAAVGHAGRVAGVHGVGGAAIEISGLTVEHAVAIDLFVALTGRDAHALGHAVRRLVRRAAAIALRVAVVPARFVAFAHVAAELALGDGVRRTVIRTLAGTDVVRALGRDAVAFLLARVAVSLGAARYVGRSAARAAAGVRLL